jgi:hypothetical protein
MVLCKVGLDVAAIISVFLYHFGSGGRNIAEH